VTCLKADTGALLWKLEAFPKGESKPAVQSGKFGAPAIADGCLVLRGVKGLKCFSLKP
jgi:outer membrane protein assembly factor BamB